jgi:hypothetical protein
LQAALYDGQIYLAQRGPDVLDIFTNFQATIYYAILQPSFCVAGPCSVYFGQNWYWDEGWDWNAGRWVAGSSRAKAAYSDPNYYNNQVVTVTPVGNFQAAVGKASIGTAAVAEPVSAGIGADSADGSIAAGAVHDGAFNVRGSKEIAYQVDNSSAVLDEVIASVGTVTRSPVFTAAVTSGRLAAIASAGPAPPAGMSIAAGTMDAALIAWSGPITWSGWGTNNVDDYYQYYTYWKEYYFLRNLYMNIRIPIQQNPCKLYNNWSEDNEVSLGVVMKAKGVIEYATPQVAFTNPIGLAYPQVAVRGGTMLVVYSFAGPYNITFTNFPAFPGEHS